MDLASKEAEVAQIQAQFSEAQATFLVHYKGCDCSELTGLRNELRESGSKLKVVKNRLAKRALSEDIADTLGEHLVGPTALVWTKEPPTAAKVVTKFAEDNEHFEVRAGVVEGSFVSSDDIEALAKLPSREELLAKLLSVINAPATRLLQTVNAPAGELARLLGAWKAKLEEKGEE